MLVLLIMIASSAGGGGCLFKAANMPSKGLVRINTELWANLLRARFSSLACRFSCFDRRIWICLAPLKFLQHFSVFRLCTSSHCPRSVESPGHRNLGPSFKTLLGTPNKNTRKTQGFRRHSRFRVIWSFSGHLRSHPPWSSRLRPGLGTIQLDLV